MNMSIMKTLNDLFLDALSDIYFVENQLVRALPKMAKLAANPELRKAFKFHLMETEDHVDKLEDVFVEFGQQPKTKKCEAIVGLLEEGEQMASENEGSPTMDAALIAASQKVEHYEIATYGCLRAWAELLDQNAAADILAEILEEEKSADLILSDLARSQCNEAAKDGFDEGDEPQAKESEFDSNQSRATASNEGGWARKTWRSH
jgi:ferritin-like metal-binding protein YciE